jgi:glycosyltransferase involved in cell wall biosynthesis
VHHIPIGTDFFESARNVSFVTPKGKIPLFLNISRMVKTKGQHLLLLAFSMYKRRGGLGMLVIGGYGTEERNLKAYCMKLGISDYVSFIGKVDDPFSVLAKATAYVTVATDEGMGVIIYDAMAAGLPIIGFNAGTITEIVVDGINGRLVANHDIDALSSIMADFDSNGKYYTEIGRANSIKIEESYTNKHICRQYYKLFESQINSK